jgi:beta-1,2-mannobiose phosphorylase / 1,2-beta-oligomannan phosphorylase
MSESPLTITLTRRQLFAGALGVGSAGVLAGAALWREHRAIEALLTPGAAPAQPAPYPTQTPRSGSNAWPWMVSPTNPVLDIVPSSPWESSAVFDPCVARLPDGSLAMWYTTRGSLPSSIALATDASGTGDHWQRYGSGPVLTPDPPESAPANGLTRPSVVPVPGGWRVWYSTQSPASAAGVAWIGSAFSREGRYWEKQGAPVLTPQEAWEKQAVQCPNVRYDETSSLFQMWYCGGDAYEPDAVGFATSPDGISWQRHPGNPIYRPTTGWEGYKIGSFQVHRVGEWYYAFYNAFQQTPFVSRVGMARSHDGVTGWEPHPANPIFSPGAPGSWDARMIYKPTALWNDQLARWDVWFNASKILNSNERIGHAWSDRIW